jgi:hypothetical protein
MTTLERQLANEIAKDITKGGDGEKLDAWAKRSPFLPAPLGLVAKLYAEITMLREKVADLEQRPAIAYKGTWDPSRLYAAGDLVTFSGSMWAAKTASVSRRPPDAAAWQLCVRKGADGRDCICGKDTKR